MAETARGSCGGGDWVTFGRDLKVPVVVGIDVSVRPEGQGFRARTLALGVPLETTARTRRRAVALLEEMTQAAFSRLLSAAAGEDARRAAG